MLFKDRKDAGIQLARKLQEFAHQKDVIVIALPRGGVVVGYEIARELHLPLDIVVPRKIGAPGNPEFAIGAITETGESILSDAIIKELAISKEYLQEQIAKERKEAERRVHYYRGGRPPRECKNKKIILVDDGLATGATMMAAIKSLQKEEVQELIVAVPVAPVGSAEKIRRMVNHFYYLALPEPFYAVGQFYEHFEQTSDEEVIALLKIDTFI